MNVPIVTTPQIGELLLSATWDMITASGATSAPTVTGPVSVRTVTTRAIGWMPPLIIPTTITVTPVMSRIAPRTTPGDSVRAATPPIVGIFPRRRHRLPRRLCRRRLRQLPLRPPYLQSRPRPRLRLNLRLSIRFLPQLLSSLCLGRLSLRRGCLKFRDNRRGSCHTYQKGGADCREIRLEYRARTAYRNTSRKEGLK